MSTDAPVRGSYTSLGRNPLRWVGEIAQLLRRSVRSAGDLKADVARLRATAREAEQLVESQTGLRVENLRVLEIGPGQLPRQLAYFAARNDVTGIDLDVIPTGLAPGPYLRLWRRNGTGRLLKTVARKALGVDARFRRELARQLGLPRLPKPNLLAMDAAAMTFPADRFDFAYSFDVFEHLTEPGRVLDEVARVLRPGGVLLAVIHPYTAYDGSHDLRIYGGSSGGLPYWPHLRPHVMDMVNPSAVLNRLRISQWRALFDQRLPGTRFSCWQTDSAALGAPLAEVRAGGELSGYTDEELLTDRLLAVWQKPRTLARP